MSGPASPQTNALGVGQKETLPQTNWKFILITVGGTVLLAFLFLKLFWFPLQQSNRRLAFMEDEYDRQRREFRTFLRERKRLEVFRLLGLPRNLEKGGSDYARYCQNLLRDCGFSVEDFQGPAGLDARNQAAGPAQKAGHIVLVFLVRAQGDWTGLVKLLEKFQRTPLLHRLKNWSIEQGGTSKEVSGKKLVLNLTIEALVVNRNDKRPDDLWGVDPRCIGLDALAAWGRQPAGWAMLFRAQGLLVPEMPNRRYMEVARANPFVGGRFLDGNANPRDKRPPDSRASVHLVLTDHAAQKAILLATTKAEPSSIKLGAADGHDQFDIWDGRGLRKGKVLRVDPRDVYVQVGKEVYGIHVGQNLAEAMKRPLSPGEVTSLGLRRGMDP
jgi:hypothetical protein